MRESDQNSENCDFFKDCLNANFRGTSIGFEIVTTSVRVTILKILSCCNDINDLTTMFMRIEMKNVGQVQ